MKRLPNPDLAWPIILEGVALIAESEDCVLTAYLCPAGKPTCGWGETAGVTLGMHWTQEYADQRFVDSLTETKTEVLAALTNAPSDHELAALVSFAYNCRGWRTSSVIKAHNRGDRQAAARAFSLWNKAEVHGVLTVLPGLTARRLREAAMYLTPDAGTPTMPMVQEVAPESKLTASPIAQSSAIAAGAGVVGVLKEVGGTSTEIKTSVAAVKEVAVEVVGVPTDWFMPGLVLALGGYILWQRIKQRREGWA